MSNAGNPVAVAAASQTKTPRTTVSVTLSVAAYAHFEAAAKREHRTLPNYLFVKLEQVFEADTAAGKQGTAAGTLSGE